MEGINKIFCGSDVKNTGICECFFTPELLTGAILVPKGKVFTEDELKDAVIQATLETAVMAEQSLRIYPFQPFEAITDSSEAPTKQTFGYGTVKTVREGKYVWAFQFLNGGLNLSNALRTFNHLIGKYAVIFLESQNTFIGTSKKDVNNEWGIAGVPLSDLYTAPWKPSDGSNVTVYMIEFTMDPIYLNQRIAFKRVSFDSYLLAELAGLEDVKLSELEDVVEGSTEATIGAETDCGSTNFFDLFAAEIAQVTAWVVKKSDGTIVTVSGVVQNTVLKGWDITISGETFEDGDTIELADPEVLAAAPINVVGYESDVLTLDFGS